MVAGDSLPRAGRPLEPDARQFFESRFQRDLGSVRLHTDSRSAEWARSVSARAFTRGQHIHFGKDQYQPASSHGRHLLAHELTHTVQQRPLGHLSQLQRAVSPDIGTIRDNLWTGFTDWRVSDQEAHEVLVILDALNQGDLRDTVAVMDREGLVGKLFRNVSDDDQADFENLLQAIQDARVHTDPQGNTVVHSCTPEKLQDVRDNVPETQRWAARSRAAVVDFLSDPAGHPDVAIWLNRNFFHESTNRSLRDAEKRRYAEQIRDNLELIQQQNNPYDLSCPSPFDSHCSSNALAYVSHGSRRVFFCNSFFRQNEVGQTSTLFHEFAHVYSRVSDTSYSHERVYRFLPPQDAVNNADSYELFARDVMASDPSITDISGSADHIRNNRDDYEDCTPEHRRRLERHIAIGQRMIQNAVNIIVDPDQTDGGTGQAEVENHFDTSVRSELSRVISRYREISSELSGRLNFECHDDCDEGSIGYYYPLGSTAHVCPRFFEIPHEDDQVDLLLVLVIREKVGMGERTDPGTPGYANQDSDEAYNNPASYVAYAREVSNRFSGWRFLGAEFRYSRGIRDAVEMEAEAMLREIPETDSFRQRIKSRFVDDLRAALSDELEDTPPINRESADRIRRHHLNRLENLMEFAERAWEFYLWFSVELGIRGLIVDSEYEQIYERLTGRLKFDALRDVLGIIDNPATLIRDVGIHVESDPWRSLTDLRARYERAVQVIESHLPLYNRLEEVESDFDAAVEQRRNNLPEDRQDDYSRFVFDQQIELSIEMSDIREELDESIRSGKRVSEETEFSEPEELLQRFEEELRQFR